MADPFTREEIEGVRKWAEKAASFRAPLPEFIEHAARTARTAIKLLATVDAKDAEIERLRVVLREALTTIRLLRLRGELPATVLLEREEKSIESALADASEGGKP